MASPLELRREHLPIATDCVERFTCVERGDADTRTRRKPTQAEDTHTRTNAHSPKPKFRAPARSRVVSASERKGRAV